MNLLLVEDNLGDVELIEHACEQQNLGLDVVNDGRSAIAYLTREFPFQNASVPDLVLLDLKLPDAHGLQVLATLFERGNTIPVIVLTGAASPAELHAAYRLGARACFAKPPTQVGTLLLRIIEFFETTLVGEAIETAPVARVVPEALLEPRTSDDLEDFLDAASHELASRIRQLSSNAGLLDDHVDEAGRARLRRVQQAAFGTDLIVQWMLEYSRGRWGKEPAPVDVVASLMRAREELGERTLGRTWSVRVAGSPRVLADDTQLTIVFRHLLANALDATSGRPANIDVQVRTFAPDPTYTEVCVRDHGRGIPPDQLERVFLPFCRLRADSAGMGMGLTLCRRLLNRHGGEIWLESDGGTGTTAHFTLRTA